MATLYVRDIPDDLYDRLRAVARRTRRSIGATTIEILREELRDDARLSTEELLSRAAAIRAETHRPGRTIAEDIRADRER